MSLSKLRKVREAKQQNGYTIVEILIVIPVASILVIVLVGALFTQYASSLAESTRTSLRANGQTILINLQDELLFTIAYGEEIEARLTNTNNGTAWAHDTSPQTLIINEIALDSARRDETRNIVRQRVNDCSTSSITANPLAINNTIYFVEDNPDDQYGTLMKRTVAPSYNICSIDTVTGNPCDPVTSTCRGNAKQTSCPASDVGSGGCTKADTVLTDKVLDFQIDYFAEGNVATTVPSAAEKIEIELTLGDRVFGKDVEAVIRHTIRKIN